MEPTALVANLPYNVAVPVVLHLLQHFPSLQHGLVMVQDEVADRLAAGPGSKTYGVPSVEGKPGTAACGKAGSHRYERVLALLQRSARDSCPSPAGTPPLTTASREQVFAVIDAAFAQRRKTLRAALAGWAGSAAEAERCLRAAGIDPSARGEVIDITAFERIAEAHATQEV